MEERAREMLCSPRSVSRSLWKRYPSHCCSLSLIPKLPRVPLPQPWFFVAAKGLKARVGNGQCTVVSREKSRRRKLERDEPFEVQGKRARMGLNKHGSE